MQRILISLLFLAFAGSATAQYSRMGIRAGILYGGPIPTEINKDSSEGVPKITLSLALWRDWQFANRWSLRNEIGYAAKAADYQQIIRNDTNVAIELLPNVIDTLPSFYVADVNGSMRLHYLELPFFAQYKPTKNLSLNFGLNPAFLLGGYDRGTALIRIGEGGIFEDELTEFENKPEIQRFDLGLMAGATIDFKFGLQIEIRGQRSIRGLYRKGFLDEKGLDGVRMYHTQGFFGLGWRL